MSIPCYCNWKLDFWVYKLHCENGCDNGPQEYNSIHRKGVNYLVRIVFTNSRKKPHMKYNNSQRFFIFLTGKELFTLIFIHFFIVTVICIYYIFVEKIKNKNKYFVKIFGDNFLNERINARLVFSIKDYP